MTNWLWDNDQRFWSTARLLEWIAGGGGWWSLLRLGAVLGGIFLCAYFMRAPQTEALHPWWLEPAWISGCLLVPYALWRLGEWRRRRERRRNPPTRTLNLS